MAARLGPDRQESVWLLVVVLLVLCGKESVAGVVFQDRKVGQVADGLDHPVLVPEQSVKAFGYDVILLVTDSTDNLVGELSPLRDIVLRYKRQDKAFGSKPTLVLAENRTAVPSGCLIYVEMGSLDRDIVDDVRRFEDAVYSGIRRVLQSGKSRPLLVVPRTEEVYYDTDLLVSVMGALQALYNPLELREIGRGRGPDIKRLGVWGAEDRTLRHTLRLASALEKGRIAMRDICASDPERMAPPKVEAYVRKIFNTSANIHLDVISDKATLEREYPILAAVNRGASTVERHQGRVIFLEYEGRGKVNKTLFFLGKGITFDTGGINLKSSSSIASMHRDKCGAAVVAGLMKLLSILKPPNLRVVGAMAIVRNSIGEESYIPDEILTARSGERVRVGNTDAEGRMIMADVLCQLKEKALTSINPHLLTIATLTGHAVKTAGRHYSIVVDNGPARALHTAQSLMETGDLFADPLEVSRLRREDFSAHLGRSVYEDLINAGRQVSRLRGHQQATAFLMQVSGLHPGHSSSGSQTSLPFTHLDIAGPSMVYPGIPQGSPMVVLAAHFVLSPEDKAKLARRSRVDKQGEQVEMTTRKNKYEDFFFFF